MEIKVVRNKCKVINEIYKNELDLLFGIVACLVYGCLG